MHAALGRHLKLYPKSIIKDREFLSSRKVLEAKARKLREEGREKRPNRSQVAQARYMSSSMLTFALLRNSSDLLIYKDLYGERNKPEKNPEKLPLNYNKNRLSEFQRPFLCVLWDF